MTTLMHFLGIGLDELTVVLIVAALAYGPDDLAKSLLAATERIRRGMR